MPDISNLGMLGASTAAGAIMGMWNDGRQWQATKRNTKLQVQAQKDLTDYNQQKQLEMWEKTGYGAQRLQMEKAGLNPGLMYGMGGGGGQSAAVTPGSVQGGSSPSSGGEAQAAMGMGLQLALLKAQKENIEADTKNKLGDAANKPKVGENLEASTASLTQGITNSQVQNELTRAQTRIANVAATVNEATADEQAGKIIYEMQNIKADGERMVAENHVTRETMASKIEILKQEAIGAAVEVAAKRMGIAVDAAQIQKMAADIEQKWYSLSIEQFNAEIKAAYPSLGDAGGNLLQRILKGIDDATGTDREKTRPFKVTEAKNNPINR